MRIEMDLNPYKGIWDTNLGKVIAPTYQEVIFDSEKKSRFSFKVTLNHNVPIKRYFNSTWSSTIEADFYNENDNYGAIINFHFEGYTGTTMEN